MIRIMEVCGTHTMAIARSGLKQLLPPEVRLISGPGCPVCVTSQETVDSVLGLTGLKDAPVITTYGDMLRVPGSVFGDSLLKRRALGADVRVVYSPMDALDIAANEPDRQVVFLGVGFETTAPGTASAVKAARERNVHNFTVLSMLKRLEPSIRALAADPGFRVQGFLCPGHVAVILGEKGMRFFTDDLHFPAVIAGFEPEEIMKALTLLLRDVRNGEAVLRNAYPSVVNPEGNELALELMEQVLEIRDDRWRGMGMIKESGYGLREEYADFDAEKRFGIRAGDPVELPGCLCGEVIKGALEPADCPAFGKGCIPDSPVGPCMVSSEGACAAAWKYSAIKALK